VNAFDVEPRKTGLTGIEEGNEEEAAVDSVLAQHGIVETPKEEKKS
jgi:hypothetical protein